MSVELFLLLLPFYPKGNLVFLMSSNLPEENEGEKMEKTKKNENPRKSFLTRRKPQRDDDEDVSEQTETEFFIRSDIVSVLCVCVWVREREKE